MNGNTPASKSSQHLTVAADDRRSAIRLLDDRVLRGCNLYCDVTVLWQRVDLGAFAGLRTGSFGPDFGPRFVERFVGLEKLTPAGSMSQDFLRRMTDSDGVPIEEALFEAILAVESSTAFLMRNLRASIFHELRPTQQTRIVELIWECAVPKISRLAAAAGLHGMLKLLPTALRSAQQDDDSDFSMLVASLRKIARRRQRSIAAEVLSLSARRRGLPCDYVGRSHLRLGHGYTQHIIHPSSAGQAQRRIAGRESGAHAVTMKIGHTEIRRPLQCIVADADAARTAAGEIGYPVALKPAKGRQTPGTTVWANRPEEIETAFIAARRDGRSVIVEEKVSGHAYRLLVVDGQLIAASRIDPPIVTGDGRRSILRLIDELNDDPLRNGVWQSGIVVNDALQRALELSGYDLDEVPDFGVDIALHGAADRATGASCTDVSDLVHPDNRHAAIRAAETSGLTVAEVGFVSTDVRFSLHEVGGWVVNINRRPDLAVYTWPRHGRPRDVGSAILQLVFPGEHSGCIPVAMVAGSRGKARVAKLVEYLLRSSGITVGLAGRPGATMSGRRIEGDTSQRHDATRFLLYDPRAEAVVGTTTPRNIVQRGLRLDRCQTAAILDPALDENPATYRQGIAVLVRATTGLIVLSAANHVALELTQRVPIARVVLVTTNKGDRAVRRHVASGGLVIFGDRNGNTDQIVLKRGGQLLATVAPSLFASQPALRASKNTRIRERMFAIALAFGAGLSAEALQSESNRRESIKITA